jgi:hypothetical protein
VVFIKFVARGRERLMIVGDDKRFMVWLEPVPVIDDIAKGPQFIGNAATRNRSIVVTKSIYKARIA